MAMTNVLDIVRDRLSSVFEQVGEQDIHGLVHANRVCEHAQKALALALTEVRNEWKLHIHLIRN